MHFMSFKIHNEEFMNNFFFIEIELLAESTDI